MQRPQSTVLCGQVKFRRVYVLFAGFFIQFCFGSMYTWAVFNEPIANQMADENVASLVPWAFSINIFFMGLANLLAGPMILRNGPRRPCQIGAVLFCLGQLVTALGCYVRSLWTVFLGFGVICGLASGLGNPAPIMTLQRHFPDRRGLAAAVAFGGFGLGAMLSFPYEGLIRAFDGKTHYVFLLAACTMLLVQFPLSFLLTFPPVPKAVDAAGPAKLPKFQQRQLTFRQTVNSGPFRFLVVIMPLGTLAGLVLIPRIDKFAGEINTANVTSWATAAAGIFGVIGRLGFSFSLDFASATPIVVVCQTLQLVGLIMCAIGMHEAYLPMYLCGIFTICIAYGGSISTIPGVMFQIFGAEHLERLYTATIAGWAACAFLSGLAASLLTLKPIVNYFTLCCALMPFCALGFVLAILLLRNLAKTPLTTRRPDSAAKRPIEA